MKMNSDTGLHSFNSPLRQLEFEIYRLWV